jgi:hypothetical protein
MTVYGDSRPCNLDSLILFSEVCMRVIVLFLVSFSMATALSAQQSTVFHLETFSNHTWTLGHGWTVDSGTPANSGSSGAENLRVGGSATGYAQTPELDLRRMVSGSVSFFARRTASYAADWVRLTASTDGGGSYNIVVADWDEVLTATAAVWQVRTFTIPGDLLGQRHVRFRLETAVESSGTGVARFDDFRISGDVLFDVEPPRGIFAAGLGAEETRTFVLSNLSDVAIDVLPPTVVGSAFSIAPSSAITISEGETQIYAVTFAPVAEGVEHGSVEFAVSGGGAMSVDLTGVTSVNRLAFSGSTEVVGEFETVDIPISFTYSNDEPLQGFQLDVSWSSGVLSLEDVLLGSALPSNGWSVTFEASSAGARVVLLDDGIGGLATGTYEPVLALRFRGGKLPNGAANVAINLDGVIGALAVPTADDAELFVGNDPIVVTVEPRDAFIEVDLESLIFGFVNAGASAQQSLTISNPGGERVVNVALSVPNDGLFSVSPSVASISPDQEAVFVITFAPTWTSFGYRNPDLRISHDAQGTSPLLIPITAVGRFGRGDNDGDGMVDVMDVVNGIDFILQRRLPSQLALAASDLYPFLQPDGALDIRDLTVSVQGIVRGEWPDEISLPGHYDPGSVASKQPSPVVVAFSEEPGEVMLRLTTIIPLRALQLSLAVDEVSGNPILSLSGPGALPASGRGESNLKAGVTNLLLYRPDGGYIPAGSYELAKIPRVGRGAIRSLYAAAVDVENLRRSVDLGPHKPDGVDLPDLPTAFEVLHVYPNPFVPIAGRALTIPVRLPEAADLSVSYYDLLGRLVGRQEISMREGQQFLTWDGADSLGRPVPAGIYLVSVENGRTQHTARVVVVR